MSEVSVVLCSCITNHLFFFCCPRYSWPSPLKYIALGYFTNYSPLHFDKPNCYATLSHVSWCLQIQENECGKMKDQNEPKRILGGSMIFKKNAACKAGEIRLQLFTARARLIYSNRIKQNS